MENLCKHFTQQISHDIAYTEQEGLSIKPQNPHSLKEID